MSICLVTGGREGGREGGRVGLVVISTVEVHKQDDRTSRHLVETNLKVQVDAKVGQKIVDHF